jgi:hypothetical protein
VIVEPNKGDSKRERKRFCHDIESRASRLLNQWLLYPTVMILSLPLFNIRKFALQNQRTLQARTVNHIAMIYC